MWRLESETFTRGSRRSSSRSLVDKNRTKGSLFEEQLGRYIIFYLCLYRKEGALNLERERHEFNMRHKTYQVTSRRIGQDDLSSWRWVRYIRPPSLR